MFILKKISKRIVFFISGALLLLALIITLEAVLPEELMNVSASFSGNDDMERAQFLSQYGWEITTVPLEVCEVTLPEEFDKVYENYNDLQKVQGFDLSAFRGKRVKRWSYAIINYPDGIENVRANLLVYDGKIIGGDICTLALNGFMHGFKLTGTGIMRQTFYSGGY